MKRTAAKAKIDIIRAAVSKRYADDKGWWLGYEVKNAVGWTRQDRYADEIMKHCNFWWVVSPKGVVEASELPETWGHMLVSENGSMRIRKDAPRLRPSPKTIETGFALSLIRYASSRFAAEIDKVINNAYRKGKEEAAKAIEQDRAYSERLRDKKIEWVEKFNEFFGDYFHQLDCENEAKKLRAAVNLVRQIEWSGDNMGTHLNALNMAYNTFMDSVKAQDEPAEVTKPE